MPAPLEPERLAELVDLAERPRTGDWSVRAALCRYAQPQPERSAAVLSVLRRVEAEFGRNLATLRSDGAELLEGALAAGGADADLGADLTAGGNDVTATDSEHLLVGLLVVASVLDDLGDVLATWAVDRSGERPDGEVDDVLQRVVPRLEQLGVAEEAPPPRGARSRG